MRTRGLDHAFAGKHPFGSHSRLSAANQLDHNFGPEAARHHHRLDASVGDGPANMAVVYASFMSAVMLRSSSRKGLAN
jgi:hypothetical protein